MNIFKFLITIVVAILVGIGIYVVFQQVKTGSSLNSQVRSKFNSICSDPNKVNDASNCLTQNYTITFGLNRANELVNQTGAVPTPIETAQLTAGLVECGLKCNADPQNMMRKRG